MPEEALGARKLADAIEALIRSGQWPKDMRLPSGTELQRSFGVKKNVVDFAMLLLRERHLVRGEPGRARFVDDQWRRRRQTRPPAAPASATPGPADMS